jgi:beta-lactamase class D
MHLPRRIRFIISMILIGIFLNGCTGTESVSVSPPNQPISTTVTTNELPDVDSELEKYFEGYNAAFVLYDSNNDQYTRFNPERCAERFLPASTFKIMNSLVGLETGVIPDENYVIQWDGTQYNITSWNQDHTLKTAIQNSVVWYYQELARRVGEEKMQSYVASANYGNENISGQIDTFWLDGELRISANEQVDFLRRLYQDELPFSARSTDIVKEILILEKTDSYQLNGKTGSAQRVLPHQGWFVGYLETSENVYFFATNFESVDPDGIANGEIAKRISRSILQELGLLQ